MFHTVGQCHTGHRVALPECGGGPRSGGPLNPAHWGITFPGILFMTWRAQGVMNGWLLVFLSRMCCHKAFWAVARLVAFQGVRRKPCMLPPFGGNFWPCLSRVNFSHFLPFDFVVEILEYRSVFWLVIIFLIDNSNVKELLFIIPLCKKESSFLLLSLAVFKEDIALRLCRWVFG